MDIKKDVLQKVKVKWETAAYALLAVVVFVFAASLIAVYAVPRGTYPLIERFSKATPYPVSIVGMKNFISERELSGNMRSIRRFYEAQDFSQIGLRVDFSTEEGQKRFRIREKEVLNKMIEDAAVVEIGKKYGITITQEMAREGVRRSLDEYGNSDTVKQDLERLYGWSLSDFEEKIVLPSLYEEKLQEVFAKENEASDVAKEKIQKADQALRDGKPFREVAIEYSDGQTKEKGGELGWFQISDLTPELQKPVSIQKVGAPGSIIESALGYHIVIIEETKSEDGEMFYRLSQVFARKATFADWMTEKMKGVSIFVLSPEYRWNAEEARAEFRRQEMREFEEEVYKNTNGDALFFF
ncbi:MAG: hypothetical protein A2808_03095 [Candidatus Moranbacteria bacterium RIFCSPHIGHO2_01_FULL_55_24]|nr:MAG: hypothetical protein A2808_03095 [Candidatus Moranbacteria bacterium RIFCSPHIGHO2_01_FULL_55_24]